jgi:electron transfer flavoprotein beta subunit
MGAKKAIRIEGPDNITDPMVTARALAEVLKQGNYDLILFGKQAIDDDMAQVPQMVAELLELPCATVVVKLEIADGKATAEREVETLPGL